MRKLCFMIICFTRMISASAQEDSTKVHTLNEVVVTATKFAKNLNETGKVVDVITEDQIRQSIGKDLSQLLNEQTGLVVNGATSNPGKDKSVYLRGAAGKYTLVMIDGVPMNDPSGIDGGAYDLRMLSLNQVERIEILKGSQSTLYGSDAIAGVINIITKKGSDQTFGGSGMVSYGSYNTLKASTNLAGRTGGIDYNVGYVHMDTEGVSEAKDISGNGNFDKDGMTQNAFQANVGLQAGARTRIQPFFRYSTFAGSYDAGAAQDSKINHAQNELINTGLSATHQLSNGTLHFLYGYENTSRIYNSDYGSSSFQGKFHNADVFWHGQLGKKTELLTGINLQSWKSYDTTASEKNPSIVVSSPYASIYLKPAKGLFVEVGARYNNHSKFGDSFTWSFNPSYFIGQKTKVFFNYSTGFKAPTLYQLFGQYVANSNLKPEKSVSTEAGLQFFANQSKADVRLVFFQRDIENVIIYDLKTNAYANFNQQNDYGFEIEPSVRITPQLTFKGYYAFVDGKVKTQTASGSDTTFNNLIRRPKNSFGSSIRYQPTRQLFVSANLKTFDQRTDQYYDSNFAFHTTTLTSYYLLDVFVQYSPTQHLKVFVDARNILNQDYMEVYGYNALKANVTSGILVTF